MNADSLLDHNILKWCGRYWALFSCLPLQKVEVGEHCIRQSRYANFDMESLEGCCGGVKIISSIGYDIGEPAVSELSLLYNFIQQSELRFVACKIKFVVCW